MMTSLTEKPLSRRDFLKGSGVLVVGFSVPLSFGGVARAAGGSAQAIGPASIDDELIDSWIVIKESGRVTIQVGKVELGTSLRTAQMQIAADELDVSMGKIDYVQGDTWITPDQGTTAGSQSVKTQWAEGLRQAAAEARAVLLGLASARLGVTVSDLTVTDGVVSAKSDASKKVNYGELIGGKRFDVKITGKAQPKKPSTKPSQSGATKRRKAGK